MIHEEAVCTAQSFAADMNHSLGNGLHFELTCRFCLNGNLPDLISVSKPIDVYCSRNQAINLQHIVLVSC